MTKPNHGNLRKNTSQEAKATRNQGCDEGSFIVFFSDFSLTIDLLFRPIFLVGFGKGRSFLTFSSVG